MTLTTLFAEETATLGLKERALADGVRFILALFVDMNGKPCAKLVPVSAADELEAGELGFAGFAAGLVGQRPQDPDLIAVPDLDSYTPVPFIREGLAIVHCDPHVNGAPWPFAPRVILKRALQRLADRGLRGKVGAEVEYFLLDKDEDGRLVTADRRDGERACYDARGLTRMYEHLTAVSDAMNQLGWANYANDHEDASGQFEQNFSYDDALVTADRVITLRYLINVFAEQRGMTATFMPKPFTDRTGSGLHLHLSLWQDETPVFPAADDARGLGLSRTAYAFIAGVLEHAAGLQLFLAPSVNSYKRRGATTSASGATWSPRRATYGGNDRTHFIRVPDGNRIELRAGDGSANPYLAIATTLLAGLEGIERTADPGDPCGPGEHRGGSAELPRTLLHAVEALRADATLLDAIDAGHGVGQYFADAKEDEFLRWHNTVSDWEITHYLTAY
ncbi:type III glutamate--ammonia ligase [Microbacterium sp. NPDC096154]|uniref:type III glutamate--ammonia ligase n=1 Tax=Microbacterium sp. NPDC096154 TaxID=3155549 RepID=UPI00331857D7